MLTGEASELESVRRDARKAAANQFEHRRIQPPVCKRADMRQARDPCLGVDDERNRTSNIAQWPQHMREVKHCCDAGVYSKVKGEIVVAAWSEQRERALQTIARLDVLSGKQVGDPRGARGYPSLGRFGSRLDVGTKRRRVCSHRLQIAPNIAAGP